MCDTATALLPKVNVKISHIVSRDFRSLTVWRVGPRLTGSAFVPVGVRVAVDERYTGVPHSAPSARWWRFPQVDPLHALALLPWFSFCFSPLQFLLVPAGEICSALRPHHCTTLCKNTFVSWFFFYTTLSSIFFALQLTSLSSPGGLIQEQILTKALLSPFHVCVQLKH